jgi:uncharacterized cupredoxin-like copper-binding protein
MKTSKSFESTAMTTRRTLLMTAALSPLGGLTALAHGDANHDKKSTQVKKEQTDWGIAGNPKSVSRTVNISMFDAMRFTPSAMQVRQGETVKLLCKNEGKVMHEFVIGTKNELDAHAALMLKFPTMEHDEPYMAHVPPGQSRQIVWTFNREGSFEFSCLIAGHYQAGMVGKIKVIA